MKMEAGICRVVVTIRVPMQLVSRCFLMIRPLEAPSARAAVTYSLSFRIRIWLRTIRAMPTQYSRAKMMKMEIMLGPRVCIHLKPGLVARLSRGSFRAMPSRMISRISGMVYRISVIRIMMLSTQPPAKADTAP